MVFAAKQMREADLKVSMVDSLEVERERPQGERAADAEGADAEDGVRRAPMAPPRG